MYTPQSIDVASLLFLRGRLGLRRGGCILQCHPRFHLVQVFESIGWNAWCLGCLRGWAGCVGTKKMDWKQKLLSHSFWICFSCTTHVDQNKFGMQCASSFVDEVLFSS